MRDPGGDDAPAEVAIRFHVHGRVQGVGYRESARRQAAFIGGLRGWIRNCPGGSVECLVAGSPRAIGLFREHLRTGPRLAEVERVDEVPEPGGVVASGFLIVG